MTGLVDTSEYCNTSIDDCAILPQVLLNLFLKVVLIPHVMSIVCFHPGNEVLAVEFTIETTDIERLTASRNREKVLFQ